MDLEPEQRAFVDEVMRPLGDDPPRREVLEEAVALASTLPGQTSSNETIAATERMNQTSRGFLMKHRLISAILISAGLAVAWLTIASPAARRSLTDIWVVNQIANSVSSMCCTHEGVPRLPNLLVFQSRLTHDSFKNSIARRIPPNDLPLLLGEPSENDPVLKWQRVWEEHPEDPAHYFAYAMSHRKERGKWPTDFVATGDKLDPENGWFRLLEGSQWMNSSIGEPPIPRITKALRMAAREKGLPPPRPPKSSKPQRVVIDPIAFQQGWQLLEEALVKPRWDDHNQRLNANRLAATPPPDDFAAWSRGQFLSISQPEDTAPNWIEVRGYHEGFRLAAMEASKTGDTARLATLDALLRKLVRKLGTATHNDLVECLIIRITAISGARVLEKAWTEIGDSSKASRWKTFANSIDPKLKPEPPAPADALSDNVGSNFVSGVMMISTSRRSPDSAPVTESNLRPGRLAEYAVYERLMMQGMAFLLLLALGFISIAPLFQPTALGSLPPRLAGLLEAKDHLIILSTGVLLPAIVYVISTRLPLLGARDISISAMGFFLWIAQATAFAVSVVLGTLQATRSRLGHRGRVLALGWVGPDFGRLCFLEALMVMPLAGILLRVMRPWPDALPTATGILWCLLAFPIVWMLILAIGCINGPAARKLHRSVLLHAAAPFIAIALVLPTIVIPRIHAEERAWTREIRFESLADNTFFSSRLEREYGEWLVRGVLGNLDELEH